MRSRYAGEIYLSFTRRGEQTVADRTFRRGNSRISANNAPGNETPYYFLISTGGGFTEGEQYLQDISLGESTHAILTTQAPGYIYKCENGRLTEQKFQIRIGDGACLEYYQDETIPYALARFRQRTEIELGRGSRLLLTDGLTAGWSADEQPFQYHDIGICTRVRRNGRLLLNDSLLVNPSADPMGEIGYFEGFTNYNSAVFFDESIEPETVDQMRESLADLSTESMWGLTYLDGGGALLRVMGRSLHENRRVEEAWIRYCREELCGADKRRSRSVRPQRGTRSVPSGGVRNSYRAYLCAYCPCFFVCVPY